MREIFLLLGSNRGDRLKMLEQAKTMIAENCGSIIRISSLYESEPWGFADDTLFINQVMELESTLEPETILEQFLAIEARLGRVRFGRISYSSRIIDIDLLFFGQKIIFSEKLMIPHPRLHERRFTLEPLNEIAPAFKHPVLKKDIKTLLENCLDKHKVSREAFT